MNFVPKLFVHGYESSSRANGPGVRFALWVQGCSLGCPGCFNPDTHVDDARNARDVDDLIDEILARGDAIEGITVSGGEPFEQPEGLLALVDGIRARSNLSILVFSGYTIDEIRAMPLGGDILARLDVLIDGRYQASDRHARQLRGSNNQQIHRLTERYRRDDIEATPEAEIRIDAHGNVTISGVAPLRLPKR